MSYDLQKYVISKALISKQEVARDLLSTIPATVFTDEHFQIIAAGIIEVGTDRNTLVEHTGIDFEEIDELSNMNAPDFPMKTSLKALIKDLLNFGAPQEPESHVQLVQGSTITPERISWLWEGWLPLGKLVIFAGQPGTGKTTVMMAVASATTIGARLPDGSTAAVGSVVIWSGEDGLADTLVPRLAAMGADMSKVYFVTGKGRVSFDPSKDMPQLSAQIKLVPDVRLIIIDPVVSVINGDSHKNAEVRKGLQPLVDLGAVTGACIVGISHFNKSGGITANPLDLISGSIAFAAVARVVLGAAKLTALDEYGHSRIFCRIKSNIGPDEDGIGYDLKMEQLAGQDGIEASTVLWGQYITGHSRDLLSQQQDDSAKDTKLTAAAEWLTELLAPGPVASKTIQDESKTAGIAFRTVRRAKDAMKVMDYKAPGKGGQWMWRLPTEEERQPKKFPWSIGLPTEELDQVTCPDFTTEKHGQLGQHGQLTEGNFANLSNFTTVNGEEYLDNIPLDNIPDFDV